MTSPSLAEEVPNWADNETVVIGISYATVVPPDITVKPVDEVRFWLWDGDEWGQLGDYPVRCPTTTTLRSSTPLHPSRSVAGHRDSSEWSASALTSVTLNAIGTSEVARMRGDVTSNPSYDRYGNTWTNHGTWSYEDMQTCRRCRAA